MTERSILGRPISGDVSNYSYARRLVQKGPEEFLEVLDAFFEKYPHVTFIRWGQGTPGFNDGEPCTFDLHEIRFGLTDPDEEADEEDDDFGDNSFSAYSLYDFTDDLGSDGRWIKEFKTSLNGAEIPEGFYDDFTTFAGEFGHFEDLFQEKFGDPAEVTATRDGFHVDYYEIGH
jgi:hypothetical protein